jgi:hypothetical protein
MNLVIIYSKNITWIDMDHRNFNAGQFTTAKFIIVKITPSIIYSKGSSLQIQTIHSRGNSSETIHCRTVYTKKIQARVIQRNLQSGNSLQNQFTTGKVYHRSSSPKTITLKKKPYSEFCCRKKHYEPIVNLKA